MGIAGKVATPVAPVDALTDEEAIARVRAHDLCAHGALYARYATGARRLARSPGAGEADADDIVAEVLFAARVGP